MHTAAPQPHHGSDRFRDYLGPVGFLTCIFFINFLSRIILAPFLPTIERDLGISHTAAGSLFLFISTGYFVTLPLSGFFSARLRHRRTIVLSAACLGAAHFFSSYSQTLWQLRAGLVCVGMAAGLYLPSGLATITALVDPRHWGKAIAIHELAPNLGFVAAPLLAEVMLGWVSWRHALLILGCLTLAAALAFARFGRGGNFPGDAPSFGAFKILFGLPSFWVMMVLFMLGISATMGIYTMLPLYLVAEQGVALSTANEIVGLSRILCAGMSFLAGWANDRLGAQRTLIAVFILSGATTILLGVLHGFWLLLLIFIQPLVAVCFFPPAFAVLTTVGPPGIRNVAVSLTIPAAFLIGGGVSPLLIGAMGDRGSFAAGFVFLGSMILFGALLVLWVRIQQADNTTPQPS